MMYGMTTERIKKKNYKQNSFCMSISMYIEE